MSSIASAIISWSIRGLCFRHVRPSVRTYVYAGRGLFRPICRRIHQLECLRPVYTFLSLALFCSFYYLLRRHAVAHIHGSRVCKFWLYAIFVFVANLIYLSGPFTRSSLFKENLASSLHYVPVVTTMKCCLHSVVAGELTGANWRLATVRTHVSVAGAWTIGQRCQLSCLAARYPRHQHQPHQPHQLPASLGCLAPAARNNKVRSYNCKKKSGAHKKSRVGAHGAWE